MQIFSNLQHKKQKHSLTGFTLAETVISIALLVMLVFFLVTIIPPLIIKFRSSAFKEQTIYLAKSKIEEYLYATPAQTTPPDSGVQRFASPYNNFWYRVTIAAYGSNTNTNLVTVNAWGPTTNQNQTNINRITLVGLAKKAGSGSGSGSSDTPVTLTLGSIASGSIPSLAFQHGNNSGITVSPFGLVFSIRKETSRDKPVVFWYYIDASRHNYWWPGTYAAYFGQNLSENYAYGEQQRYGIPQTYRSAFFRIGALNFGNNGELYILNNPQNASYAYLLGYYGYEKIDDWRNYKLNADYYTDNNNPSQANYYLNQYRTKMNELKTYQTDIQTNIQIVRPAQASINNKSFTQRGSVNIGNGMDYISVDANNNIYAIDMARSAVKKYGPTGNFVANIGRQGSGAGKYEEAVKVQADSSGNTYVYDDMQYKILTYDRNGNLVKTLDSSNITIPGQTNFKVGDFAVDDSGNIFVIPKPVRIGYTYTPSSKIYQISSSGNYLSSWSTQVTGWGNWTVDTLQSVNVIGGYLTCTGRGKPADNPSSYQQTTAQIWKIQ